MKLPERTNKSMKGANIECGIECRIECRTECGTGNECGTAWHLISCMSPDSDFFFDHCFGAQPIAFQISF